MSETTAVPAKKPNSITWTDVQQLLLRGRAFIALILVVVVFTIIAPNFLAAANIEIMAKHVAINAILGIGMTFVILTGGIDLSVGSLVGLSAMIAGMLINQGIVLPQLGIIIYPHTWLIMFVAIVAVTLMGGISGFIITRFNVAPFIATLGMLYVARGMALLINNGYTFPNLVGRPELGNTGFPELGAGSFIVNYSIWIMIGFALVAAFVAQRTPFGRQVYAIGGNERASELSGVKVKRVKLLVYMISGFCSAVVGLIIASQLVAAHPATGQFFELNAIAAVVLGGTSLSGGRGSIGGTIIGAFVIGVLGDGLVMVGVSSFWQQVIKGLVIVLAVIIDQIQARMQMRIALQKQQELG
ncbi:MAG: ABC transporter permease [Caldilinea sp.]|nr:ABC transporter permease [Caldilineaceae bacterium]MCB9118926.1 ABC transporter permease [Caldilineaceae bacterium]MCO5208726.1 ABC transporter permease [Caldilinea sp.]